MKNKPKFFLIVYNIKGSVKDFIRLTKAIQEVHICQLHPCKTSTYCISCLHAFVTDVNNFIRFIFKHFQKTSLQRTRFQILDYCIICKMNICVNFKKDHQYHSLKSIEEFNYKKPNITQFNEMEIKIRNRTVNLIQILTATQLKEDIQSVCDANEAINQDLFLLHQIIHKTLKAFKNAPSYLLMKLHTIVANRQEYVEKKRTTEDEYNYLIQYLKNTFVLKQVKLKDCIKFTVISHALYCFLIQLADGRLVSASEINILFWSTTTYQCITKLKEEASFLLKLNDGRLASSNRLFIKLWNLNTIKCVAIFKSDDQIPIKCLFQLTNDLLLSYPIMESKKMSV